VCPDNKAEKKEREPQLCSNSKRNKTLREITRGEGGMTLPPFFIGEGDPATEGGDPAGGEGTRKIPSSSEEKRGGAIQKRKKKPLQGQMY